MVAVERVDRTGQWRECAEALRGALVVDAWPPRAASHAPVHSMSTGGGQGAGRTRFRAG
jgi:hypothetical protein